MSTITSTTKPINQPTMSTTNAPILPSSMGRMLEKMKKRQLETKEIAHAEKKAKTTTYTGAKRLDLNATILAVRNTDKSERFTVIVSDHGVENLKNEENINGYYNKATHTIQIKPKDQEDYISVIPGQVLELSRYHGGKAEKIPKTWAYGDCVVLKRVSITPGSRGDGTMFYNTHWVEPSTKTFPLEFPSSMNDLQSEESYYKTVMFPNSDVKTQELRVTANDKIYGRVTTNEITAMLWQEKLFELGIWNPETLENILPQAFSTTKITLFGNKEKPDEAYPVGEGEPVRFNVRKLILGNGSLASYVEEFGEPLDKKTVLKALGKPVTSALATDHPLNANPKTQVLNLNEWSGSIKDMPATVKYYKLFGQITYAVMV